MTAVDLDTARQLIGDGVPSTGALPAALEEKAERLKTGTEGMSDIYVVTDGSRVIGASTKLQGAELIRAEYASAARGFWKAHGRRPDEQADEAERETYARVKIQNTELTDDG